MKKKHTYWIEMRVHRSSYVRIRLLCKCLLNFIFRIKHGINCEVVALAVAKAESGERDIKLKTYICFIFHRIFLHIGIFKIWLTNIK